MGWEVTGRKVLRYCSVFCFIIAAVEIVEEMLRGPSVTTFRSALLHKKSAGWKKEKKRQTKFLSRLKREVSSRNRRAPLLFLLSEAFASRPGD